MVQTDPGPLSGSRTAAQKLTDKERVIKQELKSTTDSLTAIKKRQTKLAAQEKGIERKREALAIEEAAIALRKKEANLAPRVKGIKRQKEMLIAEAKSIKSQREELTTKEKVLRNAKRAPTPEEESVKNERKRLSTKLRTIKQQQASLERQEMDLALRKNSETLTAQRKAIKIHRAKLDPRKALLKKKHGGVHPETVADYSPVYRVEIPPENTRDSYGALTDESTYSEYAWEFLRRNRFYQRLIDKGLPDLTVENWEYATNTECSPPVGIVYLKPYREGYATGTPVEWTGIHTFADQLKRAVPTTRASKIVDVAWPRSQVALTFDIGLLLGERTTAIESQIAMARAHLYQLAEAAGISPSTRIRSVDKKVLRAQLRVADLLSTPKMLSKAAESPNSNSRTVKSADTLLTINEVAGFLPSFDLKRTAPIGSKKSDTIKKQKQSRVSELAVGAWDNIYNWRFLQWLQFDDWVHLVNP